MRFLIIAENDLIDFNSLKEFKDSIDFTVKENTSWIALGPYDAVLLSGSFSNNFYSHFADDVEIYKKIFEEYSGYIFLLNNELDVWSIDPIWPFLNDI